MALRKDNIILLSSVSLSAFVIGW